MNPNPLSAYFRQPNLYITLPSRGRWWPDGSLMMPVNQELPVMSMTAGDEIILKNPDALLSGEAIVSMVQNCITNIKDAWAMPVTDLQSILIAIRISSIGELMSVQAQCPNCSEENEYEINLQTFFNDTDISKWSDPLGLNQLRFLFQPLNFKQLSNIQNQVFQNQKYLQQLKTLETEQQEQYSLQILNKMNQIELQSYCDNIHSIQIGSQIVTDREHINEFVINSEKKTYNYIKQHIDQLRKLSQNDAINLCCEQCKFEFTMNFSLDYSSFFDLSS